MGLFGREDRTEESKPMTSESPVRPQPGASPTAANITVIARPNRLEGSIVGSGDVRVEGQVKGEVDTSGQLLVAENGLVEGKISARTVNVSGGVVGDISAAERIELNASAKVEGNITAPRILINDGATFDGQVLMKDPDKRAAEGPKQPLATSSARRPEPPEKKEEEKE
jgi:cytoskeletal protein CcmA (bactofilin family)